jgi:NADH:ubiquinone oxidoreductase subunit 6 (subunit J)
MTFNPEEITRIAAGAIFAGFALLTICGAALAALARRPVRNVCGLALSFMGLAGLYYFLHSPFLALMQVLIYVGAICVVIMFALMLAEPHGEPDGGRGEALRTAAGLAVSGLFATGLLLLIGHSAWMPPALKSTAGTVKDLGRALLNRYGFAFELISLLLLLAILGALVVARSGRRRSE